MAKSSISFSQSVLRAHEFPAYGLHPRTIISPTWPAAFSESPPRRGFGIGDDPYFTRMGTGNVQRIQINLNDFGSFGKS
jgi:hypothetical protein